MPRRHRSIGAMVVAVATLAATALGLTGPGRAAAAQPPPPPPTRSSA
ncbi:hypothetical protein [Actinoallomurus acanthiterrae]